jgi:hypothetical protein
VVSHAHHAGGPVLSVQFPEHLNSGGRDTQIQVDFVLALLRSFWRAGEKQVVRPAIVS